MKKVKGLLATVMVLTILVGSLGWMEMEQTKDGAETTFIGMFTTLEDPDPVRS